MSEYPREKDLKTIAKWPIKSMADCEALGWYVYNLWHYGEPWATFRKRNGVRTLRLATGGWSGNEDIIRALDKNKIFNMFCWELSQRGGLHIYKVKCDHDTK